MHKCLKFLVDRPTVEKTFQLNNDKSEMEQEINLNFLTIMILDNKINHYSIGG